MEMLVDPSGMMTKPGPSIILDQGRVEYIVAVCDPCESVSFAYSVNGVTVSDFYTPHYFDPVTASGVRYSFRGEITGPRQILPEGYLAWRTLDGHWHQAIADAGGHLMARVLPTSASLGQQSFRELADSQMPNHHQKLSNAVRTAGVAGALTDARGASRPYSKRFLDDIKERFGVSAQPRDSAG
jgi:hypothetical protein